MANARLKENRVVSFIFLLPPRIAPKGWEKGHLQGVLKHLAKLNAMTPSSYATGQNSRLQLGSQFVLNIQLLKMNAYSLFHHLFSRVSVVPAEFNTANAAGTCLFFLFLFFFFLQGGACHFVV